MNKDNRFWRLAIPVALAAALTGASVTALMGALGLAHSAWAAYGTALLAAGLCGLATLSTAGLLVAAIAGVSLLGGGIAAQSEGLGQLSAVWAALTDPTLADTLPTLTAAGSLLALLLSALMSAIFFLLLRRPGGTAFALLLSLSALVGSYALKPELNLMAAIPGVVAALCAFALSGEPRNANALRVMIPAGIAVILALLLLPGEGTTWKPLEDAALKVRAAFEDYFRFTEERVPFALSAEGYDHAAEVDGEVVTQLGGPATPDVQPVMRVTAGSDVLLRGSIKRVYTGHAWIDPDAKARYLYYDFTRSGTRKSVFGMENNDLFAPVNVSVEMLSEGTSTLFIPDRLDSFSMDMSTAVYYNSIGEMFLSRPVQPSDEYSLVARRAADETALREAVTAAQERQDDEYAAQLQVCTQLPEGIENGVYALAMELTQGASSPADKALAIQSWLRNNCTYTLSPNYPSPDRDFVSQFVLDGREGYCSYFASAMTVMCRIAGLPARYVEGYSIPASAEGIVATGEHAHAWTEVYFSGLGWVAFDPANGSGGGDDGLSDDTADELAEPTEGPESGDPEATLPPPQDATLPPDDGTTPPPDEAPLPPEDPTASPTPSPTPNNQDWGNAEPSPSPTPPGSFPSSEPSPNPSDEPNTPPDNDSDGRTWLWILLSALLLILLLIALALLVLNRLSHTDPVVLSRQAKDGRRAAMILYRSLLTMLAVTGLVPMAGETPSAFAKRAIAQLPNPDFEAFCAEIERLAYGRSGANESVIRLGRSALTSFERQLKKGERLRYLLRRTLRGLGDFEQIP